LRHDLGMEMGMGKRLGMGMGMELPGIVWDYGLAMGMGFKYGNATGLITATDTNPTKVSFLYRKQIGIIQLSVMNQNILYTRLYRIN